MRVLYQCKQQGAYRLYRIAGTPELFGNAMFISKDKTARPSVKPSWYLYAGTKIEMRNSKQYAPAFQEYAWYHFLVQSVTTV